MILIKHEWKPMKLFKSKLFLLISSLIILILFFSLWNYDRIKFEYYVWNLSSESVSEREYYSEKIKKMGNDAVPFLIEKLDNKFIFETFYVIKNLESIIGTDKSYPIPESDQIEYWKKWWAKNKDKY